MKKYALKIQLEERQQTFTAEMGIHMSRQTYNAGVEEHDVTHIHCRAWKLRWCQRCGMKESTPKRRTERKPLVLVIWDETSEVRFLSRMKTDTFLNTDLEMSISVLADVVKAIQTNDTLTANKSVGEHPNSGAVERRVRT